MHFISAHTLNSQKSALNFPTQCHFDTATVLSRRQMKLASRERRLAFSHSIQPPAYTNRGAWPFF
jgi:hypothetical protein